MVCFLTLRVWRRKKPNTCVQFLVDEGSLVSSHNIPLLAVTMSLVLSEFGCTVVFTIKASVILDSQKKLDLTYDMLRRMKLQTWAQLDQLKGLSMAVNILAALGDALIAGSLCFFLHRSRTGFRKSDTMISKLVSACPTVGRSGHGLMGSMKIMFTILVWPSTLIYAAFYFCLGRLYSNSVLATLNARQSIRELGEDNDDLSFSFRMRPMFSKTFENVFSSKSSANQLNSNRCANISIKIDTSQQYDRNLTRLEDQPDSATTNYSEFKERYDV
ncbi:hypothetical protein DXG01_007427 [Tephrocybe rancida]|nr:hypothetical protein DXG01_007427 [Tephrocybe rancida]